jgi:hypothetical protein
MYFDRYRFFRENGFMKPIPGILIPESPTDKSFVYKRGETRLDKISLGYYSNPYSGWLILQANPQFGGLEFLIPDNTLLRVPYPYDLAIQLYIEEIKKNINLYGK